MRSLDDRARRHPTILTSNINRNKRASTVSFFFKQTTNTRDMRETTPTITVPSRREANNRITAQTRTIHPTRGYIDAISNISPVEDVSIISSRPPPPPYNHHRRGWRMGRNSRVDRMLSSKQPPSPARNSPSRYLHRQAFIIIASSTRIMLSSRSFNIKPRRCVESWHVTTGPTVGWIIRGTMTIFGRGRMGGGCASSGIPLEYFFLSS